MDILQKLIEILIPAILGGGFTWLFHARKNLNKSSIETTDQVVSTYEARVLKSMEVLENLTDKISKMELKFNETQSELSEALSQLSEARQLLQAIADDCNCSDTHSSNIRKFLQKN